MDTPCSEEIGKTRILEVMVLVCVILYVKDELHAIERRDIKDENFRESVWCEIKHMKEKVLIGVYYRVPDAAQDINK